MENLKKVLRDIIITLLCILIGSFILVTIVNLLVFGFNTTEIFKITDQYLKLILTSWPASVIIIGSLLLLKQQDAIDEFIRKRMTSIGPSGVNAASSVVSDASEKEIKTKAIEDIRQVVAEDTPPLDSLDKLSKKEESFAIEENVQRAIPNTKNQDFLAKLKKARVIEEHIQVYLLAKYGETYKPNIKLNKNGASIILDGILTLKKNKFCAVEIRYIGASKKSEALKFIIIRLRDKLRSFGIRKLLLIMVADDINAEEATKIKDTLTGLVVVDFYNFKNGTIEQVEIPNVTKQAELL